MTKIVKINEDYRVRIDEYNHLLEHKTIIAEINPMTKKPNKNAGGVRWDLVGYYPNMSQCLRAAAQLDILSTIEGEIQLKEYAKIFDDISNRFLTLKTE